MKAKSMKNLSKDELRLIVVADIHAGSYQATTHPDCSKLSKRDKELKTIQSSLWDFYSYEIRSVGEINWLVVNGDAIDGKARRNGGNDVMTTNLVEQVDMAKRVILYAQADNYLIIGGTEYHVRENGENFEEVLAKSINGAIYSNGGHFRFTDKGFTYPTVFNFRHFMGGRAWNTRTGALKRYLINDMIDVTKGDRDMLTDVLIRSHIHAFDYVKGIRDETIAISTPALQASGTTFGQLKCDGEYTIGFLEFIIRKDGSWTWKPHLAKIPSLMSKVQDI